MSDERTRVYTPYGRMAHLLPLGALVSFGSPVALCRRSPALFDSWRGTGSQAEYDKAAALPLCQRCKKAAGGER